MIQVRIREYMQRWMDGQLNPGVDRGPSDNNGLPRRALRALALRFAPGHAYGTSATLNVN